MAVEAGGTKPKDYPKSKYLETLLLIAGAEVVFTWLFLVLVGLYPGTPIGSLEPISSAVGFAIIGLGILEFGVVVLNVQLLWLLPADHDESGVAPFLCGYCLLGQVLLMFPPLIVLAIFVVPLVLLSVAGVGWYFQKFTSLKLARPDRSEQQKPLSMQAILWMPVCVLALGLLPLFITLFTGPYFFELAFHNTKYLGIVIICSSIGMMSVSCLPLLLCYGYLLFSQCARSFQWVVAIIGVFSLGMTIAIEALASDFTSSIMPLVSMGIFMFVGGLWAGLKPWQNDGLQVVFAKPTGTNEALGDVRFEDVR